jgi:short-subunit dehydrogenase
MPKRVVIFGANGGIGQATAEQFLKAGYIVVPVTREMLDFTDPDSYVVVENLLENQEPDVIVNCVGYFDTTNQGTHTKTFDVNFGSNWAIVNHYINHPSKKPVGIVFVGSSAYKSGKKNYMLYSASKAALHNLWEGAREFFTGRGIAVNIVHPVRTRTSMVAPYDSNLDYLDPNDVAQTIVELAHSTTSDCREISFKE